jgi:hypothetical protein
MNLFWNFSYLPKGLKLVKEMLLQELVHLVIVARLSTALLEMLDLV